MNDDIERITGPAIRTLRGTIYSGGEGDDHGHIMEIMRKHGEDTLEIDQGFVTNSFRYVDREEARTIALQAGQITKTFNLRELFSEDLWKIKHKRI